MMAATFEGAGVARRAAHHERQRAAREALDALGDAPPAEVGVVEWCVTCGSLVAIHFPIST